MEFLILQFGLAQDLSLQIGNIITAGEPTAAGYNAKSIVYFVYAYVRGFDLASGLHDVDMRDA